MACYLYLHGFASSPQSAKARYLHDRFQSIQQPLLIPDLNQNDFSHLTLTRQIHQVQALVPATPTTLIGSSFGGLTAAWVAERCPTIERLVLLAPAFQFLAHWIPRLGPDQMHRWQTERSIPVYHYGAQQQLPLSYDFIIDCQQYQETTLQRPIPTLILHGVQDEVIPVQASRDYAAQRPWVQLVELNSDHALVEVQDKIWQQIQAFCQLETVRR